MTITERLVGDVTILALHGKMTLGEGDEILKSRVARVIASGRRHVILDLAEVPYIDSAGKGEIVRMYTTIRRAGGMMVLLHLTKRIVDLLTVTKLLTVFETYDSELDALRSFGTVTQVTTCPVCRLAAGFGSGDRAGQRCANCLSEFTLRPTDDPSSGTRAVDEVAIPTYEREQVIVRSGQPYVITIAGRLDLFTVEAAEQAWRAVPRPRKVLIELGPACALVTSRGASGVATLCEPQPDGGRAAVWYGGMPASREFTPPADPPFFAERDAALAALHLAGDAEPRPMLVEVRDRGAG